MTYLYSCASVVHNGKSNNNTIIRLDKLDINYICIMYVLISINKILKQLCVYFNF